MKIRCFRCGKEIDTPDETNADYVMAADIVTKESREILVALKHNQTTRAKEALMKDVNPDGSPLHPDIQVNENEFDRVEIADMSEVKRLGDDVIKIIAERQEIDVPKTGVICLNCHRPSDLVIWGRHKMAGGIATET